MPVITLDCGPLKDEQREELIKSFTATASRVMGLPESSYFVFLNEYDREKIGVSGVQVSKR